MQLAEMERIVAEWAESEPLVFRAYIFGSSLRGKPHPDDLDVAVEIVPKIPYKDVATTWFYESDRMLKELQSRLPVLVDLVCYENWEKNPSLYKGLFVDGSKMVFERIKQVMK
ncbi:MAG: nucleotidyltransferase family protein [Candidatus Latescibacterota bacterium]